MLKRLLLPFLALLLLASSPALAQTTGLVRYDGYRQPAGYPFGPAFVAVCASGGSGGPPCSPTVIIYSDASGTKQLPNPFQINPNGNGNYTFFAPGTPSGINYALQTFGTGYTTILTTITLQGPGGGGGGGTGTVTHTAGPLTAGQLICGNAGADITTCDLTGDGSTSGGTVFTLAVLGLGGSCGDSTHSCGLTIDTKGRITAFTNNAISGGSGSAGANGNVQTSNGSGGFTASGNVNDISNLFSVLENAQFKGPVPYVDATAYGVRAVNPNVAPAIPGITANCVSGNTSVVISAASTFKNGDSVVLFGCGAAQSMSTMIAPTVTPAIAAAPTGTGYDVTAPPGLTNGPCYISVARDRGQGLTAKSGETCPTNGQPLGAITGNISTATRVGNIATYNVNNTLSPGALVQIFGTSDPANFDGWETVTSATGTSFTVTDGRNANNGATSAATGGVIWEFNDNHVTFAAPTGAMISYGMYVGAAGAETLYDIVTPDALFITGDASNLAWDDFGSPMMSGIKNNLPYFWPNTPPAAATNDSLTTTIVSGAGTTTLVLANAPSATVSGTTILFDDGPNMVTAMSAANTLGGYLLLPATTPGTNYVINSFTTLTGNLSISQGLILNDTLDFQGKLLGTLQPNFATSTLPQFGLGYLNGIAVSHAKPGVILEASSNVRDIAFGSISTGNGFHLIAAGSNIPSITMENVSCGTAGAGDYMSICFTQAAQFAAGGAAGDLFRQILFTSGPNQGNGLSTTPNAMFKNMGEITFDGVFLNRRSLFFEPNQAGLNLHYRSGYEQQGPIFPQISTYLNICCISAIFDLNGITMDTGSTPALGAFGANPPIIKIDNLSNFGTPTFYTGIPAASINVQAAALSLSQIGQNFNLIASTSTPVADGLINPGTSTQSEGVSLQNQIMAVGQQDAVFTTAPAPPAPTCAVSAGGSVPVAAYTFIYAQSYPPNNGLGVPSLSSTTCTTTPGNQTVTITPPNVAGGVAPGAGAFYENGHILSCSIPAPLTSGSYVWSSPASGPCSSTPPSSTPGGGVSGIAQMQAWSFQNSISGFQDFIPPTTAPTGVATRIRVYADPVASWIAMKPFGNTAFFVPGISGSVTPGNCTNWVTSKLVGDAGAPCGSGSGSWPGILLGDLAYGGPSSGSPTRLPGPTGPNGIPQTLTDTPASGLATAETWSIPGVAIDAQTGTSYPIPVTDDVHFLTGCNAAPTSWAGFPLANNYVFSFMNLCAGTITYTPNSGSVNGNPTQLIPQNWFGFHYTDNSLTFMPVMPTMGAFPNCTDTGGNHLNFSPITGALTCGTTSSTSGGTVTHTAGPLPVGYNVIGNGAADIFAVPSCIDSTQQTGANMGAQIATIITAVSGDNQCIESRGYTTTQNFTSNFLSALTGEADIWINLPAQGMLTTVQLAANASDVVLRGMGTGGNSVIKANTGFPSTSGLPILTMGDPTLVNLRSGERIENLRFDTNGITTATCLTLFGVQEFSGLNQVNCIGANNASATAAAMTITGAGHYTVMDSAVNKSGANDGLAIVSTGFAGGLVHRFTANNTGSNTGLAGIHITASNTNPTFDFCDTFHAEGFANGLQLGAHVGGACNFIDTTGTNTDVVHLDSGSLGFSSQYINCSACTNLVNDLSYATARVFTASAYANELGFYTNATAAWGGANGALQPYSANHTANVTETSNVFTATSTATINTALTGQFWFIIDKAGTTTLSASSGNVHMDRTSAATQTMFPNTAALVVVDGTDAYAFGSTNPATTCIPGSFASQTDAATVTWAIASNICANASLTFTVHSGSRTLNLTGLINGGSYVIWLKQDATGGENLTGGTGCTWKQKGGGGSTFTLTPVANAIDILAFTYDGTNCYANLGLAYN